MTGSEARDLVAVVPLPEGWHVEVQVLRKFRYRDKLRLVAHHDSMPRFGWEGYAADKGLAILVGRIEQEAEALTVTTDAAGWIRSIEGGAA